MLFEISVNSVVHFLQSFYVGVAEPPAIETVGNPSGVPGKSHVCSNSDETVPRSATVSFALDSLSDGVSSVQFTPPSTISPQVESCSLG